MKPLKIHSKFKSGLIAYITENHDFIIAVASVIVLIKKYNLFGKLISTSSVDRLVVAL